MMETTWIPESEAIVPAEPRSKFAVRLENSWLLLAALIVAWFLGSREFSYYYPRVARVFGLLGEYRTLIDLVSIVLLCLITHRLAERRVSRDQLRWSWIFFGVYGAFVWLYLVHRMGIQNFDAGSAKSELARMFLTPIFGYCVYRMSSNRPLMDRFLHAMCWSFAVLSAMDFFFARSGFGMPIPGEVELGASPAALAFLFALFWFAARLIQRKGDPLANSLGILLSSGDSILIFWKPALLSAAVGLVILVLLTTAREKEQRRRILERAIALMFAALLVLAIVDVATGGKVTGYVGARVESKILRSDTPSPYTGVMALVDKASTGRLAIWEEGIRRIKLHPWYGNGFTEQYTARATPVLFEDGYIDLGLSLGLGGLVLGLGVLLFWLVKVVSARHADPLLRPVVVCYIVALLFYNIGIVSRQFDSVNLVAVTCLGLGAGLVARPPEDRSIQRA